MSDFVHLHCHTEYSLLKSTIRIKDLCRKARDSGMQACAITDYGNLFGAPKFLSQCKRYGLKPIIGCEIGICAESNDTRSRSYESPNHLILLAKNNTGYHNLVKLVSLGFIEGSYDEPRVNKAHLHGYAEGLVCLSACLWGEIPQAILADDMDQARTVAKEYASIFPGRFYLELQSNGYKIQEYVNTRIMELAEYSRLPLVATNDIHYLDSDDANIHDFLTFEYNSSYNDILELERQLAHGLYYKTPEEMEHAFSHVPEAIANTALIAESCQVELDYRRRSYPISPLPVNEKNEIEFMKLCEIGLDKRLESLPGYKHMDIERYRDRLRDEMWIIIEKGLVGHFLILHEVINWARNNDIPVGPGSGSMPSSLVAWALKITNIDPIRYNLLFEQFLNMGGSSFPNFEVDFCTHRRADVIKHILHKYGVDKVAKITTFYPITTYDLSQRMDDKLRSFVKYKVSSIMSDAKQRGITIGQAMEQDPGIKIPQDVQGMMKFVSNVEARIKGLTLCAQAHPTGVVVSDRPIEEYIPFYCSRNNELITQFDAPTIAKAGFLIYHLRGLKALTLIHDTLTCIERTGSQPPNIETLPMDDYVFNIITYEEDDSNCFSHTDLQTLRKYSRMLSPTSFEDIIALQALTQRGPLRSGMLDEFIDRRNGYSPVVLPHKSLSEFLHHTYGIPIYQEQIIQIAQKIACYSPNDSVKLFKNMRRKKLSSCINEINDFIECSKKNKINAEDGKKIFIFLHKYSRYCVSRTQAVSSAFIFYFLAYLRAYHPAEFMEAKLKYEIHNMNRKINFLQNSDE